MSVIVFAYGAKTLFRDVPARSLSPRDVLARIDSSPLRFGRYTDCAGALARAVKICYEQQRSQPAMPTRVYLLTDGPRRIQSIPEEYVVRQIPGEQLYKNLTEPLPLRIA